MKKYSSSAVLVAYVLLVALPSWGQQVVTPPSAMAKCKTFTSNMIGDARKQALKTCMQNAKATQGQALASCKASLGDKRGAERKAFLSECVASRI